jgi:YesN/AraC family two-component response regulator
MTMPRFEKCLLPPFSDGFKTYAEAENGKEAVEAAKQIKPGVVTLDLSMPVGDGLRPASLLRRAFPTTPIILFTLYRDFLSKGSADGSRRRE